MELLVLLNALPFIVALLIGLAGTRVHKNVWAGISTGLMAAMFAVFLTYLPTITEQGPLTLVYPWVPELGLALSFYVDGLALLFAVVVTGIGAAIALYTRFYLETDAEIARFYMLLLAFAGAMLGVVLAGNLITLFIMWELTSITSFLLIGFKGDKYASARYGALQALLVTGAGGLALLVGLILTGTAAGSMELSAILGMSLAEHPWYDAMLLLLALGAFTKSAQFPFHFWLPGAKDAPAPASAFLHSATMVKLGVYLMARFQPVLGETELWTGLLVATGLFSLLLSSFLAIRSMHDLKTILAYTTIGQLGALIALAGLGDMKALAVGVLAHALYKAPMFLIAGVVDHATGTRDVNRLGGLGRYMPALAVITALGALSMSGMIPWLGFVSKEVLLQSFVDVNNTLAVIVIGISAALTVAVAAILVWDVFMRQPPEEIHFHDPGRGILIGPAVLVGAGSVLGLLLPWTITPLITPVVPKEFSLYLLPPDFLTNPAFLTSAAAIVAGLGLFAIRRWVINMPWPTFVPTGARVYDGLIAAVEAFADLLLRSQNGKIRYYLVVILGSFVLLMAGGGVIGTGLENLRIDFSGLGNITSADILDVVLLVLAIGATFASILFRDHLTAALAMGVMGYAVGGIFLLEPSPDVALVQFLVETLATVLIILMIARISIRHRRQAIARVFGQTRAGLWRDAAIATLLGVVVGLFAIAAVTSRADRADTAIANWHLENTYPATGVTDSVAAILADFRGTDTLIEIAVFGMASLGVLTLLSVSQQRGTDAASGNNGTGRAPIPRISTPLTRRAATLVLPIALLISISHVLYGGSGPGDGFTAGVISGLGVALWFVVFPYDEARRRLGWVRPGRLLAFGLVLGLANAAFPLLLGENFFQIIKILPEITPPAGLHLASTLIFEFSIYLTVFGGVSMVMDAIAHPEDLSAEEELSPETPSQAEEVTLV